MRCDKKQAGNLQQVQHNALREARRTRDIGATTIRMGSGAAGCKSFAGIQGVSAGLFGPGGFAHPEHDRAVSANLERPLQPSLRMSVRQVPLTGGAPFSRASVFPPYLRNQSHTRWARAFACPSWTRLRDLWLQDANVIDLKQMARVF